MVVVRSSVCSSAASTTFVSGCSPCSGSLVPSSTLCGSSVLLGIVASSTACGAAATTGCSCSGGGGWMTSSRETDGVASECGAGAAGCSCGVVGCWTASREETGVVASGCGAAGCSCGVTGCCVGFDEVLRLPPYFFRFTVETSTGCCATTSGCSGNTVGFGGGVLPACSNSANNFFSPSA